MGAEVMVDEYYQRYRRHSHTDLYRQLRAGAPQRVEQVADVWHQAEETLTAFAANLRADLAALRLGWSSAGGREYQYRMGRMAERAQKLVDEAVAIGAGLSLMAETLAEAQRRAEPSAEDGGEWAFNGLLDASIGHNLTAGEQSRSYERIVVLVAELSAAYDLAGNRNWPAETVAAPTDLPGEPAPAAGPEDDGAWPDRSVSLGLAGDGVLGPGSAPGSTAAPPVTTVTTLTGAGLAGAAGSPHLVAQPAAAASSPDGNRPIAAGVPMGMAGPAGAGQAPGVVHGDSGLLDEGAAWSTGETVVWGRDDDPPPPVLGDA